MIWVLMALGAVVGVSSLVVVVGSVLPRGHSVSRVARLDCAPAEVWQVITDFADQASWRTDVRRVERLPTRDGREVWRETDNRGQAVTMETVELLALRRLVRRLTDENHQFSGRWTYELAEDGGNTLLTVTEQGETYNPVYRFVDRFITGQTASVREYVRALGRKLGVQVTITGA